MVLRAILSLPLVVALLLVIAPSTKAESYDEHLTFSKQHLKVVNLIGEVQVTRHEGSGFDVVVHVRGKDASRERIYARIDEATETLVVHYPLSEGTRFVYPNLGRGSKSTFHWNPKGGAVTIGVKDLVGLGDHPKITVTSSGSAPEMWADIELRVPDKGDLDLVQGVGSVSAMGVDGELNLELHSGPVKADQISGALTADTGSGSVTISNVNGRVVADTGSGRVTVDNVNGDLNVDTGSGSVSVSRVRGKKVHADTGSGSVHMSEVACDDLRVDTGSGGIEVQSGAIDEGHFDTGSGSVKLVLDQLGGGPLHVDTGSGSVTLDLPANPSATVNASTGSGGIHVDLQNVDWVKKERDDQAFRIGNGKARISLETGSGSIRVRS